MEDGSVTAVDTPAGDTPVGDETVQQQGDQQQQDGQQAGQQQQGQQGDPRGDEFADADDDQRGGGRANERIRGLVDTVRTLEQRLQQFESRGQGGNDGRRREYTPAEEYGEVHKGLGGYVDGYIRHYAAPLAQAVIDVRQELRDVIDRMDFYQENGNYDTRQRGMIERSRAALTQETGQPWTRADVVRYLRGHEKYGKRFQSPDAAQRGVEDRLVTARRGAGGIGARPVMRSSGGAPPDLSKMSPAERVKLIEDQHGDAAI